MNVARLIKKNKYSLLISKICYKLHLNLIGRLIAKKRINRSVAFLESQIPQTLNKDFSTPENRILTNKGQPVFLMWLQGENSMPLIVKKCYQSIKSHFSDRNVILLTQDNLENYYNPSDSIKEKLKSKKISFTTFSDVVRNNILKKYGGTWIDSTAFISGDIEESFFDQPFYTICGLKSQNKKEWKYVFDGTNGWTTWFMGTNTTDYPLFVFMSSAFDEYFSKNDYNIDYFQMDLLIHIFLKHNSDFRHDLNKIPISNTQTYDLANLFGYSWSKKTELKINKIKTSTKIHKLTYKRNWDFSESSNTTASAFLQNKF